MNGEALSGLDQLRAVLRAREGGIPVSTSAIINFRPSYNLCYPVARRASSNTSIPRASGIASPIHPSGRAS